MLANLLGLSLIELVELVKDQMLRRYEYIDDDGVGRQGRDGDRSLRDFEFIRGTNCI